MPMPVRFACPHCAVAAELPDAYARRVIHCPQCGGLMQLPDAVPRPPPQAADPFAGIDDAEPPRRRFYRPPGGSCFLTLCWVVVWGLFALGAAGLALRAATAVVEGSAAGNEFVTRAQLDEHMWEELSRLGGWFFLLLLVALGFSLLIVIAQNLQRMGERR